VAASSTRPSLLNRLRDQGDQDAWREFSERYSDLLLRFALRRGMRIHDAEDVVQATLARLARSLVRFEYRPELGTFRGYLRRVVEHELMRAHARRLRDPACSALSEDGEHLPHAPPEHDAMWEEEWVQHHYRLALAAVRREVTPKTYAAFAQLLEGASPAEVAATHALAVDAVYKIKQRMRERLQTALDAQLRREEFRERDA